MPLVALTNSILKSPLPHFAVVAIQPGTKITHRQIFQNDNSKNPNIHQANELFCSFEVLK
jgi:hypothetical protein